MNVWLRLALLFTPAEFRKQYGDEIAAGGRDVRASDVFDVAATGIRLRVEDVARDLQYALRRLAKAPLFAAVVVLTFAFGIGANIAVFSVLNAVILRPLPYLDPNGVVQVRTGDTRRSTLPAISIVDVDDLRAQSHTLASIAAATGDDITVELGGRPVALDGLAVMPEYCSILGLHAQLGRMLVPGDSKPGMHDIVISDAVWHRDFNGDPAILNREVSLDAGTARVVGILPRGQLLINPQAGAMEPFDYISALDESAPPNQRAARFLGAIARLAPATTVAQANAEMQLITSRLEKRYPGADKTFTFSVRGLRAAVLGSATPIVWTVFGAVLGILLIACANVGNMLGARWSARDREFAVRRSLGASSWNVARLLLVETGVLACAGAIAGIGIAYAGLHFIGGAIVAGLPRGADVNIDLPALAYALIIVIVTTVLAALPPIVSLNVRDLNPTLKTSGRGGDGSSRHGTRAALVVIEIAIALAMVTLSALMVRGFIDLANTPTGMRSDGLLFSDVVGLPTARYSDLGARRALQARLLARLRALPGVDTAALTVAYPLGNISLNFDTAVLGKSYPEGAQPSASGDDVSSSYFEALGIPLLRGRSINDGDTASSEPVVVVNQAFANSILAGRDPIGAKIRIAGWNKTVAHWATVVGVVGDTRPALAGLPAPTYYAPITQAPPDFFTAAVHAPSLSGAVLGREVQSAFAAELPTMQPPDTFTVAQRIDLETATVRTTATLLTALASIALLITLAGIFGVVSFSVSQRSREFGVRMALGARSGAILLDVLRRTAVTTTLGVVSGVVIAAIVARVIATQVPSLAALDPLVFAGVVFLIFTASSLASLQPALRATRIHPVDALRYE
ncbi:MAG TPA: ADOP family duplicated permease [Candidatus Tumulicola sp.]